ncbi:MAG: YciI family protein [Tepidiformaceae bacterium]
MAYHILFYDYVEDAAERRTPFRPEHLELLREYEARGEVVMAGAFANPLDGAAIVFNVEDAAQVEAFVAVDPFAINGVVRSWKVREWTVVLGG